jgi:hypothetical protein
MLMTSIKGVGVCLHVTSLPVEMTDPSRHVCLHMVPHPQSLYLRGCIPSFPYVPNGENFGFDLPL